MSREKVEDLAIAGNQKVLRWGYTTGACAAAAARAAAQALLTGEKVEFSRIKLPREEAVLGVESWQVGDDYVSCGVRKDAGDDPDSTDGLVIWARVRRQPGAGVTILGGEGVGRVTKPGLPVPVGEWAINPVPRRIISDNLQDFLSETTGLEVTISVPGGEKVAQKTTNPRLGIVDGISILGTTGRVRPLCEEAFLESLKAQLAVVRSNGYDTVVLVPGNIGEASAARHLTAPACVICQMGDFVGNMIDACVEAGIPRALLWGHYGKIGKIAAGSFHTNHRMADGRMEVLAAIAGACGADPATVRVLLDEVLTDNAVQILRERGLDQVFFQVAERVAKKATERARGELLVGAVVLDGKNAVLGYNQTALQMVRDNGWASGFGSSE